MTEYAIVVNDVIENVVATDSRASAERVARSFTYGDRATVVPFDSLPDDVKRRATGMNDREGR